MSTGTIISCKWRQLPKQMRGYIINNLTFGEDGIMVDCVRKNTPVFIAMYNERPIGWALIGNTAGGTNDLYGNNHLMAYVENKYRRRGIGTVLVKHANKYKNNKRVFTVSCHNCESKRFFESALGHFNEYC